MNFTITKGRLTRWIIAAVILFCSTGQADVPGVMVSVVANREFLAGGLPGYENYHLHDIYELRKGLFYVVMLCPAGIQENIAFDTRNGKREAVYHDAMIPRKPRREKMRRESVFVYDAVKLAKKSLERQKVDTEN